MNPQVSLEKAKAYLDLQLNRPSDVVHPHSGAPFITISREAGSGGSALADDLCRRLNRIQPEADTQWTAFDRNIVDRVLADHQLSARIAEYLPEDKISEIDASVGEIVGLHPSLWNLLDETHRLMRRLASLGHVVLVGRGANFVTGDLPGGFHLRLVGSPERRAHRMAHVAGVTLEEATVRNRRTDTARRDYVRSVFSRDVADPLGYDLVVNVDRMPPAAVTDLVLASLHAQATAA